VPRGSENNQGLLENNQGLLENNLELLKVDGSNIDGLAGGLSELHHSVGGRAVDPAHWRWCYVDNPTGKTGTIVALRAGRVVGKFGSVYMRLVAGGERVTAGLMEGLSIEPSERSWQCLSGLMKMSLDEAIKAKVAFGFGFATRVASELSTRLGAVSLGPAPIYSGFINTANVLRGRSVPFPLSLVGWLAHPLVGLKVANVDSTDLDIRGVESFDNSFDGIWDSIEWSPRTVAVVKDSAYLNWRYVRCPDRRYVRLAAYRGDRPEGLIVYRSGAPRHDAFLLELLARDDDPETMRVLLSTALGELRRQKAGLVSASFPTTSRAAAVLNETGFKPWGSRFWNMDIIVATERGKGASPELDLSSWDFSLGDWLYH
jgi:hypothetical protein